MPSENDLSQNSESDEHDATDSDADYIPSDDKPSDSHQSTVDVRRLSGVRTCKRTRKVNAIESNETSNETMSIASSEKKKDSDVVVMNSNNFNGGRVNTTNGIIAFIVINFRQKISHILSHNIAMNWTLLR